MPAINLVMPDCCIEKKKVNTSIKKKVRILPKIENIPEYRLLNLFFITDTTSVITALKSNEDCILTIDPPSELSFSHVDALSKVPGSLDATDSN